MSRQHRKNVETSSSDESSSDDSDSDSNSDLDSRVLESSHI
jgi:hypothetical protein